MKAVDVVYESGRERWVVARVAQRGAQTFVEYTDEHIAREVASHLSAIRPINEPGSSTDASQSISPGCSPIRCLTRGVGSS